MTLAKLRCRLVLPGLACALLLVACAPEADSAEPGNAQAAATERSPVPSAEPVAAARFGEPFPGGVFPNVNPQAAGGAQTVDLAALLGKRPIVLYYWVAGNPRADQVFGELQTLVERTGGEIALLGVVMRRTAEYDAAVAARIRELGIRVPVLDDRGFELGQRLRVQSVPNITIIDGTGRLRLTNGASLAQDLEYEMTLTTAIDRVARKGSLGTYGFLDQYYPVREMVGKKCPDFKAPLLSTSVEQRWSSMIRDDRLNVLIFWSVDCPHCRTTLPEINAWLKSNGDGLNVISAAKVTSEATRVKTREFCDLNGFVFPTLVDQDLKIAALYNVTSTPTILIIRPDGVIDSVMLDAHAVGETLQEKKKALLGKARSS